MLQPDAPQILLSGNAHSAHPVSDFEAPDGVPLFPNLQISCSISHQVEAKKDENWHGTGEWSTEGGVIDKLESPTRAVVLQRKRSPSLKLQEGVYKYRSKSHCLPICRLIGSYPFLLLPVLFLCTQFLCRTLPRLLIPNPFYILPTFPFIESSTEWMSCLLPSPLPHLPSLLLLHSLLLSLFLTPSHLFLHHLFL